MEEEFELTEPLSDTDLGDDDSETDQLQAPSLPSAEAVSAEVVADVVGVQNADDTGEVPFEFDDDDDLDDFDDLSDIDGASSPGPHEKTSFFSDIDLDDPSSADALEDPFPMPADLMANAAEPNRIEEPSPPFDDLRHDQVTDTGTAAVTDTTDPTPLLEEPVLQKASKPPPPEEIIDPPKLEEVPTAPLEASLALQPIPELQREAASRSTASPETNDEDADAVSSPEDSSGLDDDDDLQVSLTNADASEIDMLDLEGLELDPLEMETSDQVDDHIADDWHAHMADVLAGSGALDENIPSKPGPKTEPSEPIEKPTTLLPLSKTLAQLAATSEPAAEATEPLVPTFLTRTARQKTAAGQPPSTLPAEPVGLSPSQLSLGIITNVPRLRRFAAVQIGDEQVADQLVQSTIETAFADPSALQHSFDLGLALITLLHQHRREALKSASAPKRSPEAARSFETALCRGLAGADQFEIHQFAQAINGLEERDRELLVLVALENLAYEQIAAVIQVPTEQVMSMISTARMRLRQALATDELGTGTKSSAISIPHSQEIEIHGYLDGELDGHHMADVDALVEYDEDAADRLLHYGIQGDLIRRLYAPLLNRPVPGKMLDAIGAANRPARRGFGFGARRALIVGAFIVGLGGAAFWPYLLP